MIQTQSSNLGDPFEDQSVLSLIPRTHRLSKEALKSKDPEAVHQYMKSMALQSPDKHFEEAQSVIDSGLKILKTKYSQANTKDKENPQHHRPGLDRKRAKFSMKPVTSQSSTIVEPTLEVNHLQDPDEFFAAFEKFENTKKEIKRQRGEKDADEVKTSTRVRRPELPRKKVSYTHHDYSSQSQDDMSFTQETLQDNIESQPTQSSQQESLTTNLQFEEDEETGSIAKSEKRVDKLFDELMSSNINKLDGNEAMFFLKDRMNIKPVEIEELQLPKFNEIPRADFISPVKNLPKDPQSILSDTYVLPDITNRKTVGPQKRFPDKVLQSLGSPTPPRNPLLGISTLQKNMMKSLISKDPFSSHEVDSPPVSPGNIIDGGSSHASKDNEFPVSDINDPLENSKVTETDLDDIVDSFMDHNMEERDVDDNATDVSRNEDINGNSEDMLQKEASVTEVDLNIEDIIEENVKDVTEKERSSSLPEVNIEQEVNVEVSEVEGLSQPDGNSIKDLDTCQSLDDIPEQEQNEEEEGHCPTPRTSSKKKKKIARKVNKKKTQQNLAAETVANSIEDLDTSGPTQNLDDIPEQEQNEVEEHPTPRTKTEKRKRKINSKKSRQSLAAGTVANNSNDVDTSGLDEQEQNEVEHPIPTTKKRKKIAHRKKTRQSLSGAGSSWTSAGVRQSSRIKRRPLEYWNGERLLIGRVHNSLPTVIGVKYISPGKSGFKVESFVSDKYKDLVELTSFH